MLDGVRHVADAVPGVEEVSDVRARWLGHRLRAEVNVAVSPGLSVARGHATALEVDDRLRRELPRLDAVLVHVDPLGESGEEHHRGAPTEGEATAGGRRC